MKQDYKVGKSAALCFCMLVGSLALAACQAASLEKPTSSPTPSATAIQATATVKPLVWYSPPVPEPLRQIVAGSGLAQAATLDASTVRLDILSPQSISDNGS